MIDEKDVELIKMYFETFKGNISVKLKSLTMQKVEEQTQYVKNKIRQHNLDKEKTKVGESIGQCKVHDIQEKKLIKNEVLLYYSNSTDKRP